MLAAPPRLARAIVRLVVPVARREEIEGDLLELFRDRVEAHGARHARIRYWHDLATVQTRAPLAAALPPVGSTDVVVARRCGNQDSGECGWALKRPS